MGEQTNDEDGSHWTVDRKAVVGGAGFTLAVIVIALAATSSSGLTVGGVLAIVLICGVTGTVAALAWRQQQRGPRS